jgi:hypothetical protein
MKEDEKERNTRFSRPKRCIALVHRDITAHGSKGIFLLVEGKDNNIHIEVLSIESKRKACIT